MFDVVVAVFATAAPSPTTVCCIRSVAIEGFYNVLSGLM
jgi:hypothetical protein